MSSTDKVRYDPSSFLGEISGKKVNVRVSTGTTFSGVLQSVDGYMSIVLENAEELVDDKVVGIYDDDVFIRGNNVLYVAAADK
ncbi:YALIA101S01e09120g1_1 [Yarrowia lipolytica]|nr:U6 snRNA-associated Sm-like protein LSm6 [Yarrowia sp. B02]QNP96764.1 Meiosis-specific transcription factor NDT80 [Yarrowia lipolytica]SEI30852.1 YALIA101S01e09120g1_1 [Yarrowia lipolytica]VBB85715.1 Component of small nuclear ribonucleoprotein complexes, putative [Yarrowia lipolytica]